MCTASDPQGQKLLKLLAADCQSLLWDLGHQSSNYSVFTGKCSHSHHLKKHTPYLLAGIMPLERGLGLVSPLVWCCWACSEITDLQVKNNELRFVWHQALCELRARNRGCLPVPSVLPEIPCTETAVGMDVRSELILCGSDILQVWCKQPSRWTVQWAALLRYREAGWLC